MWPFSKKPEIVIEFIDFDYQYSGDPRVRVKVDGKVVSEKRIDVLKIGQVNTIIKEYKAKAAVYDQARRKLDTGKPQSSIWHVLGCMPTTDRSKVESAYRKMAMVYHPDHGGTSGSFQTLTLAKEKALAKCK